MSAYTSWSKGAFFESKKSPSASSVTRAVASAGTIAFADPDESRVVDDAFVRRRFRRVVRWRGSLFRSLGGRRARPATARLDDGAGVAKRTALGLGP